MKRILLCAALFAASFTTVAQVGVGNTDPKATLDVTGDAADTASLDGIIAPRLTGDELRAKTYTADQLGAIVYATVADTAPAGQTVNVTEAGYYSFDGTEWVRFASAVAPFEPAVTVYVDTPDPANATKHGEEVYWIYDDTTMGCIVNPDFVDNAALADDAANLYVGHTGVCTDDSDGSEYSYWISDGTDYSAFAASETTEWFYKNTPVDAGSDKTSAISRDGMIAVGEGISATDRFAIQAGHLTDKNPRSAALSATSIYGIFVANRHKAANVLTGMHGIGTTNYNYSDSDMTSQYGNLIQNFHYGTGKVTNLRGLNNSTIAYEDSGSFTAGYGINNSITNRSTSTDAITTFYALTSSATHSGAGRITNARGAVLAVNSTSTSGGANSSYGITNTVTNSSLSTDAIANMYGVSHDVNLNSAGLVTATRGVASNVTADNTSGGFDTGVGMSSIITNNSPSTVASSTMYGFDNDVNAQGATRMSNLRGINNAVTNTAGSFSAGYGINNTFTASSASTDDITTFYGYSGGVTHNAAGRITNMRGINQATTVNAGSGSVNTIHGLFSTLSNNTDDTTLVSSASGATINNYNYGAGDTTTQIGASVINYGGNTADDGGVKTMYGGNFNTQFRTKNTAGLANTTLTGIVNSLTHSSVLSSLNVKGQDVAVTVSGDGGVTTRQYGSEVTNTNTSASTAAMTDLIGSYSYNLLNGTQSATSVKGEYIYNYIAGNADGGTVANHTGLEIYNQIASTATTAVTDFRGIYVRTSVPTTSVVTNAYGLYLNNINQSASGDNYSIYSAGGDTYLTNSIRIGDADGGTTGVVDGAVTPVPQGGAGTIIFKSSHFYGWTGTEWKQLDN
jgi:hypothetical protein